MFYIQEMVLLVSHVQPPPLNFKDIKTTGRGTFNEVWNDILKAESKPQAQQNKNPQINNIKSKFAYQS